MAGQEEERDVESEDGRDSEEEEEEEEEERGGELSIWEKENKKWIKKNENEYFIILKLYREATGLSTLRACPIVNLKPQYSLQ